MYASYWETHQHFGNASTLVEDYIPIWVFKSVSLFFLTLLHGIIAILHR